MAKPDQGSDATQSVDLVTLARCVGASEPPVTWSATLTTPLSKSQIQRLRREAKRLARERDTPHLTVLHELAAKRGFTDWSQLLRAAKAATSVPPGQLAPASENASAAVDVISAYQRAVAQLGLQNPPSLQEVRDAMQLRPLKVRGAHRDTAEREALTEEQMAAYRTARRIAVLMTSKLSPTIARVISDRTGHSSSVAIRQYITSPLLQELSRARIDAFSSAFQSALRHSSE